MTNQEIKFFEFAPNLWCADKDETIFWIEHEENQFFVESEINPCAPCYEGNSDRKEYGAFLTFHEAVKAAREA